MGVVLRAEFTNAAVMQTYLGQRRNVATTIF
jgi:hypothetical protein